MMKSICLILIVLTVERTYGLEDIAKILADCKTSEKVPDVEIMNFKNKVMSETKEAKCLTTCIMEKVELIKGNQINVNGMLELAKSMPNSNEKMLQSATEVVDECKPIKEAERCEYGFKVSKCLMDAAAKRQLGSIFM
ncbi:general odorant-binding protein 19d-like [Bradysia coprophila]|uniref:general odorant-binding protein 19d-like n=1 Tax=Bradysia coprophila TaxID=38358 RepID=UPI00187D9B9D|nr:general odorant-binding protein 19d-like [Bradysia coprophila]